MAQSSEKPLHPVADREERFRQIRHLQTLRWAYLSTYLLATAWFVASSYDIDSALRRSPFSILAVGVAVSTLGFFLGMRVQHFTNIIRHDLEKVRTTIQTKGWIEYVFLYALAAGVLLFALIRFTLLLLYPATRGHFIRPWY